MKKTFFTLLTLCAIIFSSYGQTNKGTWLLGGNIHFNNVKDDDNGNNNFSQSINTKTTTLTVSPHIGWFISQNLVIGLTPSYHTHQMNREQIDTVGLPAPVVSREIRHLDGYSFAPFIRYYKPLNEKWAIVGEFTGINYHFGKDRTESKREEISTLLESTYQGYQIGIYVSPGITYFVSPRVSLGAYLGAFGFGFNHTIYKTRHSDQPDVEKKRVFNSQTGGLNLASSLRNISVSVNFYIR